MCVCVCVRVSVASADACASSIHAIIIYICRLLELSCWFNGDFLLQTFSLNFCTHSHNNNRNGESVLDAFVDDPKINNYFLSPALSHTHFSVAIKMNEFVSIFIVLSCHHVFSIWVFLYRFLLLLLSCVVYIVHVASICYGAKYAIAWWVGCTVHTFAPSLSDAHTHIHIYNSYTVCCAALAHTGNGCQMPKIKWRFCEDDKKWNSCGSVVAER